MSMTRTIKRNMIRREMTMGGRRHYDKRERDPYGNKLPSAFSLLWKKLTGQKHAKVKRCAASERR